MGNDDISTIDRALKWVSLAGGAVLIFLAGSMVTEFEVFPYPQFLENAYEAFRAKREQLQQFSSFDPEKSEQWKRVRPRVREPGMVTYDKQGVQPGLTLWSMGGVSAAWLTDFRGNVLHEWYLPWREAYPDRAKNMAEVPPSYAIKLAGVHLYSNGDLLGTYTASGTTPYGYGLVRMDEDSNPIWTFPAHVHHDVDLQEDGKIWALTHRFRGLEENPLPGYQKDTEFVLEDFAALISRDGEELKEFSLNEAVAKSEWRDQIHHDWIGDVTWDVLHTNNIEIIGEDFAEHHDFAEAGQMLVSFRNSSSIALIDVEEEKVVWARQGFWVAQHDPDPYPNGDMLLYDNKGYAGPGGASRIVVFDPSGNRIKWSYTGTRQNPFFSPKGGKAVTLPNGNVLFNEPQGTRVLEVARSGRVVWEFRNPMRVEYEGRTYTTSINGHLERVNAARLDFEPDGTIGDEPIWEQIDPASSGE